MTDPSDTTEPADTPDDPLVAPADIGATPDSPASMTPDAFPGTVAGGSDRLVGKTRGPWVVWLLSLVTFGIYFLYWYYKVNNEVREYDGSIEVEPGISLLAQFIPIANIVSAVKCAGRSLPGPDHRRCAGTLFRAARVPSDVRGRDLGRLLPVPAQPGLGPVRQPHRGHPRLSRRRAAPAVSGRGHGPDVGRRPRRCDSRSRWTSKQLDADTSYELVERGVEHRRPPR